MFTPGKPPDKRRTAMNRTAILLSGILLSSLAMNAESSQTPVYQAGGQYTAVLSSRNSQWHMVPRVRQDFSIVRGQDCQSNITVPAGLWLLTRDADGRPELLAPSQTMLPAGHSGRIPLIGCAEIRRQGLPVPAGMLAWLSENTGAVYVE
jgi:hypothetical protein